MKLTQNKQNTQRALGEYLSLLQLKYDCETIYNLLSVLQKDGITSFGLIPYITLTTTTALEFLESNTNNKISIPNMLRIKDVRIKLKLFEDGYSQSKKMLLNIDYLQHQVFKNQLRFDFMKNYNIHYNLGLYSDKEKHIVGNTQYNYYLLQDNRFLKKSLAEVAKAYMVFPEQFDLGEQAKQDCFKYSYACVQIINAVRSGLSGFDFPVNIASKFDSINYYYADYNTNVKSTLFPNGEDGKAIILYLLHILSTINFLLYVLNNYMKDDCGWWLKINYITYYYSIQKLRNLQQHLIQNKLITTEIADYFDEIHIENAPYLNSQFRNYIMHSKLIDKNEKMMIDLNKMDKTKPLFGLVETCFDGIKYQDLKLVIISEMSRISNILSRWLNVEALHFKPF